jgi:hypothetical protein
VRPNEGKEKSLMNVVRTIAGASLVIAAIVATTAPVAAQHPVEGIDLMIRNLRESGQPVIPIYEGWFPGRNGGYDLCFGYFNLNLEEARTLQVGPENRVEPARLDGAQPTHFDPVPPAPNRYRRTFCAFTVHVDDPSETVTWTLTWNGQDFAVPSNTSDVYQINEPDQRSRSSVAPVIRFEPEGPEGQGRHGELWGPEQSGTVGSPVELTISATHPEGQRSTAVLVDEGVGGEFDSPWFARWALHSGPGEVAFSSRESEPGGWITIENGGQGTDRVTFSEPGRYVLRLQVIDAPGEGGSFQFQCCWTNAYVEVDIS